MTKEKIAWQVSNSLVYGTKRISYFTFWLEQYYIDEGDTNACVDYKGNVYPRYYDVQEINKWLLPIGTEIFNKTSTAVFHVLGSFDLDEGCTEYTSYGKLGKVLSLDGDFAIGFFDDESFIISNKNYTSATETNKLYLVDLSLDTKLEYFDTDTATWQPASNCSRISVPKSENEKYSVTLNHGNCIYLRVAD